MIGGEAVSANPPRAGSRPELVLDPRSTAAEALRAVLRALLETLLAHESGTRSDTDPECLHDFRVAVRRARSALGQIREVLPAEAVAHLRTELAWLGQATGPTRDLDVYLLTLREEKSALPAAVRADLGPLVTHLRAQQRREQAKLRAVLDSERYRGLIDAWKKISEPTPVPTPEPTPEPGPPPANAALPVIEVARARIARAFRRVVARGRSIDAATPPEVLHRLRIECKKLRYLLEFFRSLWPKKEGEMLIRRLKRLQDNLGTFNDCQVQQRHLEQSARELAAKGRAPVATLLAMGRLLAWLEARQHEERRCFAESFEGFASKPNRRELRRWLAQG